MFEKALNLLESGKKDKAILECRKIARLGKDEPKVLKLCSEIAVHCGETEDALKWLQKAVRLDDRNADCHYGLGTVYMRLRRFNEAVGSFQHVLRIDAQHADAKLKLGLAYYHDGANRKALRSFQEAIQADPNQAVPYCWLGIVFTTLSFAQKAEDCFVKAIGIKTDYAEAHFQLGLLYLNQGQLASSRDCFYNVISIERNNWQALGNLCMVLRDLGDLEEASKAGHRAAKLNPNLYEVWHNLGNVHKEMGKFHDAAAYYAKAIQINPESAVSHVGLGIALHRIDDNEKAVQSFERALEYNPSEGTAINNLYNIAMMDCDWEKADYYEQLVNRATIESLRNGKVPAETPFLNLIRSDDPALNFEVARSWSNDIDDRMADLRKLLGFTYRKIRQGKIRIGYLSNNFGDHPTAHITRRLYKLHDRSKFEIYCYSYGTEDKSRYRKSIQAGCDSFVDIQNLSHAQAARRINDDGINILVDLVGYMRGGRVAIAALRPAPIQIRWLGMAGTTGADFFDYLITDKTVTPEEQAGFYSEKFVYLPNCYQINDNQPFITVSQKCRSDYGLPEEGFVFCCFNTSYKIDKKVFSVWMNILNRTTKSVLWIMAGTEKIRENLKKAAVEYGLKTQRLIFAEKVSKDEHLARLSLADLALDTHRVNGAATTSDALWAGIPVLTTQGEHFASRMSSSLLKTIRLKRLVAKDLQDYQNLCVQLAKNKQRIKNIKSELSYKIKEEALFNTRRFVTVLELAYKSIWIRYIKDEKPTTITI